MVLLILEIRTFTLSFIQMDQLIEMEVELSELLHSDHNLSYICEENIEFNVERVKLSERYGCNNTRAD